MEEIFLGIIGCSGAGMFMSIGSLEIEFWPLWKVVRFEMGF